MDPQGGMHPWCPLGSANVVWLTIKLILSLHIFLSFSSYPQMIPCPKLFDALHSSVVNNSPMNRFLNVKFLVFNFLCSIYPSLLPNLPRPCKEKFLVLPIKSQNDSNMCHNFINCSFFNVHVKTKSVFIVQLIIQNQFSQFTTIHIQNWLFVCPIELLVQIGCQCRISKILHLPESLMLLEFDLLEFFLQC